MIHWIAGGMDEEPGLRHGPIVWVFEGLYEGMKMYTVLFLSPNKGSWWINSW